MPARSAPLAVAALAVLVAAGLSPASARVGPSTAIAEPSGTTVQRYDVGRPGPSFVVSGTASGTTSVDIDCVTGTPPTAQAVTLASSILVTGGTFQTTVTESSVPPATCRLAAVPSGSTATDDVSAFTGPVLHTDAVQPISETGVPYGLRLFLGDGQGVLNAESAGFCGDTLLATLNDDLSRSGALHSCLAVLPKADLSGTASPVRVDGHQAFLPSQVFAYSLGLTEPLVTSVHVGTTGDVTWRESAGLLRCQKSDTFPPTQSSCGSLVTTGVRFTRSAQYFRDGHQVRMADTFTSTDTAAHSVDLRYFASFAGTGTGPVGYRFPGHGSAFSASSKGEVVTGLGSRTDSLLVRSDLGAGGQDPSADTRALTWSRAPSRLAFSGGKADQLEMSYRLAVPASGLASLGLTDSERPLTTDVEALVAEAVADLRVPRPAITSPHPGGVVHGRRTTVRGTVTAGPNGLPVSVRVDGHLAKVTATSATKASFSVRFKESLGKHTLIAVARDTAGNTAHASLTIHNR